MRPVLDVRRVDLGTRRVPFEEAWALQREVHAAVLAGDAPPTLLLVEHEDVYTAGRRTASWDRPTDGTPVVDVDRGGRITWHGPGQLVGYPIVPLAAPVDVVAHVRRIESAVHEACAALGLRTVSIEGRSGVWVPGDGADGADGADGVDGADGADGVHRPDRKVAAIGVRVARGVTMHGFALNCDPDLAAFDRIVPCGITDAGVTSLTAELGRRIGVLDVADLVADRMAATLTGVPA